MTIPSLITRSNTFPPPHLGDKTPVCLFVRKRNLNTLNINRIALENDRLGFFFFFAVIERSVTNVEV